MKDEPTYEGEIYEDRQGEHRWRLIAENGRVVASSHDGYVNAHHCAQMFAQIFAGADNVTLRASSQ